MLTAEARVETERASRYLTQLCRHFDHVIGPGRREDAMDQHPSALNKAQTHADLRAHVEWSETHGLIDFDWGRCSMQVKADALTLSVEASYEDGLERIQQLVTEHLDRFGARDQLVVNWRRSCRSVAGAYDAVRAHRSRHGAAAGLVGRARVAGPSR